MKRLHKKYSILKILFVIFTILAIISLVFILINYSNKGTLPFQNSITISERASITEGEDSCVIIDNYLDRLAFINNEKEVVKTEYKFYDLFDDYHYYGCAYYQDNYYVLEYCTFDKSEYVKTEKIYMFDKHGNMLKEVLSIDYDLENNRTLLPQISSFCDLNGRICFCRIDYINKCLYLGFLDDGDTVQDWKTISYSLPENNTITSIILYDPNTYFCFDQNDKCYKGIYNENSCNIDFTQISNIEYDGYNMSNSSFTNYFDKASMTKSFFVRNLTFSVEFWYFLYSQLFWIALGIVVFWVISVLIYFIAFCIKYKKVSKLKVFGIFFIVIIVALGMVKYYSDSLFAEGRLYSSKNLENIKTISSNFANKDQIYKALDYHHNTGEIPPNDCFGVSSAFEQFTYLLSNNESDCSVLLLSIDKTSNAI